MVSVDGLLADLANTKPRVVSLEKLRLACVACGEILTDEVRVSPEGEQLVVYVRPCNCCSQVAMRHV